MAASGGPSLTSSGSSQVATRSMRPQSSLNSALSSASDAYGADLPTDSLEAEIRQTRDEGETSEGQEDGKSSKHPSNKARQRGICGQSVNGQKTVRQGTEFGHHGGGEIEGSSPHTLRVENSAPTDDVFEGDATEPFEASELEIIEDALKNLHLRSRRQPVTNHEQGSEELETPELSLSSSNRLQDLDGVTRLLKKVQAVRTQKTEAHSKQWRARPGTKQGPLGGEGLNAADICQVVQAASQAALAAAKAAETVASLVNRNSQAIENLCKTLRGSSSLQLPTNEDAEDVEEVGEAEDVEEVEEAEEESTSGNRILAIELRQTEISKNLVRQNRITHAVLGVMIATTFIWRFVVVKFVKKVNDKIQNPFEGITDMFDGITGGHDQEHGMKEQRGGPGLKFPQLIGDNNEGEQREKHKSHKPQENGDVFSKLGSILPG